MVSVHVHWCVSHWHIIILTAWYSLPVYLVLSVYFEEIRCGNDNNGLFFGVVRRGVFGREVVTIIQLRYSRVEYLFIMYIILVCFVYYLLKMLMC